MARYSHSTQYVCAVKMPSWMAPRHRAAAVRVCAVSHLHSVPTTGRTHFSQGGSIPLGSLACCTFYYTDEASRLLTDTTKKKDAQRFQVAAAMGTSVPGLPIRDCAERYKSSVPRFAKVSTIDVMKKTIFEHLYLVQGLGTLCLRVKCPYVLTPPPLTDQRFPCNFLLPLAEVTP